MNAVLIFSVIILLFIYAITQVSKTTPDSNQVAPYSAEMSLMINEFHQARTLSMVLTAELCRYCEANNAWGNTMFPGFTYSLYIEHLKASQEGNLSPNTLKELTDLHPLPPEAIQKARASVAEQTRALADIRAVYVPQEYRIDGIL